MSSSSTDKLTFAQYAERGIALFACNADKSPRTAHVFKDATTDTAAVRTCSLERATRFATRCLLAMQTAGRRLKHAAWAGTFALRRHAAIA
jgi:hypothetical protein